MASSKHSLPVLRDGSGTYEIEGGPDAALASPAVTAESDDPFKSREGSPRIYTPQSHSTIDDIPRLATDSTVDSSKLHTNIERHSGANPHDTEPYLIRSSPAFRRNPFSPPPSVHVSRDPSIPQRQSTRDTRIFDLDLEKNSSFFKESKRATLATRLAPTINHAEDERNKYAKRAKLHGYTLNAAIGLQVLLGSLTTGLSAAATKGKSVAVQTTILGGLSTLVASYLARARGSNEPELSISRVKDLDQFIRECQALSMDHGHDVTGQFDEELKAKRRRFEELLGNASGERKLSSPV